MTSPQNVIHLNRRDDSDALHWLANAMRFERMIAALHGIEVAGSTEQAREHAKSA